MIQNICKIWSRKNLENYNIKKYMNILSFKNINFNIIKDRDETERIIGFSSIDNGILTGRNHFYPNTLIYSEEKLISPYDEKVMSLNKESFYDNNIYEYKVDNKARDIIENPVFFFIYNFDNYYHFLYDTLPYLYTYFHLKEIIPNIKLLVNYPNINMDKFYRFNTEFLDKIIDKDDLIIHNDNYIYKKIFISTSLTHGGFSNNPPRKEIFEIFEKIKSNIDYSNINEKYKNLQKIYISRRTWINNDKSNIGTDYTSRRKMMNEDNLVEILKNNGITEIFSENLNTDEKIYLFSNADFICGSIGGGMANLLFSKKKAKTLIIVTPYFLEINYRFKYSMENTNITYFHHVETYKEKNIIPLYCRAKIINKESEYFGRFGEICDYKDNKYLINIANNDVAGFNNQTKFKNELFFDNEFELLDKGLNSPYIVNIPLIIELL